MYNDIGDNMNKLFEFYIEDYDIHMKYARGMPSVEGREFHDYNEIVLFLDGNAQFISKNIQLNLIEETLVIIPKESFHQFSVKTPESYERFILGFKNPDNIGSLIKDVMTDVSVISNPNSSILNIFHALIKVSKSNLNNTEKILSIRAGITALLIELKLFSGTQIEKHFLVSKQTKKALNYIDTHYAEDLSLNSIANYLNISVSSLSHGFKKDLNISVYKYLTEKRLSVTRQLIEKGKTLNEAAFLSGFKDYSSFFRLYKNHFGNPPSKK